MEETTISGSPLFSVEWEWLFFPKAHGWLATHMVEACKCIRRFHFNHKMKPGEQLEPGGTKGSVK